MRSIKGFVVKNVHKLMKISEHQINPQIIEIPSKSKRSKANLDESLTYKKTLETLRGETPRDDDLEIEHENTEP